MSRYCDLSEFYGTQNTATILDKTSRDKREFSANISLFKIKTFNFQFLRLPVQCCFMLLGVLLYSRNDSWLKTTLPEEGGERTRRKPAYHLKQGEQWYRSCESTRFPLIWLGFDSWTRRRMWVEFVVDSSPCSEGVSPGSLVFLPPQKTTLQSQEYNVQPSLNKQSQICLQKRRKLV